MIIALDENNNNSLMILINAGMEKDAENLIYGYEAELVEKLITQVNKNNDTPLLLACKNNMKSLAELLCSDPFCELEMDNVNKEGYIALIWSCYNNMTNIACIIIENNMSNLLHIDPRGNTALIISCSHSLGEVAILLLEKDSSNVNHVNKNDKTALLCACYNNLTDVIKKMIQCKCNVKHSRYTITPLQICHKNGNAEAIIELINYVPSILEQENDIIVMEILEEYYDELSIKGKLKGDNLMKLLEGTMFEYMLVELVKYKEKNGDLKIQLNNECLFCMTSSDYCVCFDGCYHVIHTHKECINGVDTCPMCRKKTKYFVCYVN
jgi:ankyrin repeat protein